MVVSWAIAQCILKTNVAVPKRVRCDRLLTGNGFRAESVAHSTENRYIIKGYQYQIGAIKQLKQTSAWEHLYFAWAGTGTLADPFKRMVQQAGVSDRVKFLGELGQINEWLDASDIFLLPLAMMEAMAKGLPVAASAVSSVPEGLGDMGQLLTSPMFGNPQSTIQELVATLKDWVSDATRRQQVGWRINNKQRKCFAKSV